MVSSALQIGWIRFDSAKKILSFEYCFLFHFVKCFVNNFLSSIAFKCHMSYTQPQIPPTVGCVLFKTCMNVKWLKTLNVGLLRLHIGEWKMRCWNEFIETRDVLRQLRFIVKSWKLKQKLLLKWKNKIIHSKIVSFAWNRSDSQNTK